MNDKLKDMVAHARGSLTVKFNAACAFVGGLITAFPSVADVIVHNMSIFLGQAQSFASHEAMALVGQVMFFMGTASTVIRSLHNSQASKPAVAPVVEAPAIEAPKDQTNG